MTNEDVIDLYNRVKMGSIVVVLAPKQGRLAVQPEGRDGCDAKSEQLLIRLEGAGNGAGWGSGAVSFRRGAGA